MKIKYIYIVTALIIVSIVAAILFSTCAEPVRPLLPVFKVVSLHVTPATAEPGREATVTAEVQNTGNVQGDYQAVLSIDGEKLPARIISIAPGDIGRVTFKVTRDQPGQYDLTLGNAWATLTVKKFAERPTEIYYGSPDPKDFLFAGANGGHLIDFTPADASFKLTKIGICGGIYGAGWHGKSFEIFVLNRNMSVVFSQVLPITLFPQREHRLYQLPVWREIEVEETSLPDKFYIYVYTSVPRLQGLHLGVESSMVNEHSDVATGLPPNLTIVDMATLYPGLWCADRSKVNWMIRAAGTIRLPE